MRPSGAIVHLVILLQLVVRAGPLAAQEPVKPEKPATESSYLNVSFEAQEALARAEKHAKAGSWTDAATAYQSISDRYGAYLIGVGPRRYESVRTHVGRVIAGWPAEGRAEYRELFAQSAGTGLELAQHRLEIEPLLELADRFYPTAAAAAALDEAGERSIEAGDFDAARRWYERLASSHPDRAERGARWSEKAAFCATFTNETPQASGLAAITTPTADPGVFAGGPDRRGLFTCDAQAEARLWRFSLVPASPEDAGTWLIDGGARQDAWLRAVQSGRLLGLLPVSDSRRVYLHDARSVWAVDPDETDKPAWRYDISPAGVLDLAGMMDEDPPPQYTSLLADGRLYAHLELDATEVPGGAGLPRSCLICLEAATGKLLWRNDLQGVSADFAETRLDGAPILYDGRLFAVVRRRKQFGFEACLLARFDPRSGELVWSTHIGEAATGSYGYHRPTRTHPAAGGDLVFVASNLGSIAAVSIHTGRVAWLRTYDSRYADAEAGGAADAAWPARPGRPIRAWNYPSAIIWRDAVVCAPLDSDQLFVIRRSDGEPLASIPLESIGLPETILGVSGDLLYAVGADLVCLNLATRSVVWQRPIERGQLYGRGALTTAGVWIPTERALLRYPLDGGPPQVHHWGLHEAGNLLPLGDVEPQRTQRIEEHASAPEMLADQIVVASAARLTGLSGRSVAFARLERRCAEAPADAFAPLALAELAFDLSENQRGISAVEETIRRCGGFAGLRDDALRRRVFDRLMSFAAKVADEGMAGAQASVLDASSASRASGLKPQASGPAGASPPLAGSPSSALSTSLRLLEMAGQCAPDAAATLAHRFRLARTQVRADRPSDAVATCQLILEDRGLRAMKIRPVDFGGAVTRQPDEEALGEDSLVQAGIPAAESIRRLIAEHGRGVYSRAESRAEDRLRVAREKKQHAGLLAVAEAFPNSRAAVVALAEHARLLGREGRPAAAIRAYRRALADEDHPDRLNLLREIIECLVRSGRSEDALEWLDRGARDHPRERFDVDGESLSFKEYRAALLLRAGLNESDAAVWPVREAFNRIFPDRVIVLEAATPARRSTSGTPAQPASEDLLLYASGAIEARSPAGGRALWPKAVACRAEPQWLGVAGGVHVFATAHRIFALTSTSGAEAWSIGREPPDNPEDDPESFAAWTCHTLVGRRLFSASDRSELVCINTDDGGILWRSPTPSQIQDMLVANDEFACYLTWRGRRHIIHVVSAASGETVRRIEPETDWPVQALALAPDGALVVVLSSAIVVVDPRDGEIRWKAATGERFVPGTLRIDEDGVIISPDGGRLIRYELASGRPLWSTPRIGPAGGDGLWLELYRGVAYGACGAVMMAFDALDGRMLWSARGPAGVRTEAPRIVGDSLVMVAAEEPAKKNAATKPAERDAKPEDAKAGRRFTIRRYRLGDGLEQPVGERGPLVTPVLDSYAGTYPCGAALIVVDGGKLYGYLRADAGQ